MGINFIAVLIATILDFIVGFIWYGPIFGKLWGKIHGFDTLSKEVQQKMMAQMGPYFAGQLGVTLVTNVVLAIFLSYVPDWNPYALVGFLWLGFVIPTQFGSIVFGGTEPKWMMKKLMIQAGASLICLEVAAAVMQFLR